MSNTAVVVRGHQLDGPGEVRFGQAIVPDEKLVLPAPADDVMHTSDVGRWRDFPSSTRIQGPGCYGYQVDTPTASYVIVLRAVPAT